MISDDGNDPRSPGETSNGGQRLSPSEFWELVRGERQRPDQPPDPPSGTVVVPPNLLPTSGSLEDRLRVAQDQGLGPNLRRQLAFVGAAERVFEFQTLGVRRYPQDSFDKSRASHARGPEEAIALCTEADDWLAHGVYVMPARLRPGVETRHAAPGRWFDIPKGSGTTDSDVEARLVVAVDFDVKRASGISATEEEMQRSVRVAQSAWNFLAHHFGESSLAYLHSGNGRQIHVALDSVEVTDQSKNALAGLLAGMAHLFNTPEVTVDEKLYDAKRILPACGTVKKKGSPGVDERPHRRTAIVAPEAPTRVALSKVIEVARLIWEMADGDGRAAIEKAFGVKPQTSANVVTGIRENPNSPFALANDVDPQAVADWLGIYNARGEAVCPGCGETSGVAVLNRGLKCHHNRCRDRGRGGFRTNIDLVAEVHRVSPKEALAEIGERFGLDLRARALQQQQPVPQPPQVAPIGSDPTPDPVDAPQVAPAPAAGAFALPPSRFTKLSTTEVFAELDEVNWLVKELHIVKGRPTLIAGYGFSGKTLIAQSALLAMASGHPVWGKFKPDSKVTVWHLDYEQGSYATKKRYQRLALGHGIARDDLDERLQVSIFPDVYLDSPDAVDAYSKAVEGVSVCALDALRGATPTMDENDSKIRRCLDNLSRISEKIGTAFLVLHHAGKTRDGENSDPRKIPRGSSAIFDACGCVFAVEGEKNEPKLVNQTKAPAEAEGAALDDFYVKIEDVAGEKGPTAGLKVLYQEGTAETEARIANEKLTAKKQKILATVAALPGELTSANSIWHRTGGKKESVMTAISELIQAGLLAQPGGDRTPFVSLSQGTGSHRFQNEKEPVPGSPPLKGGTGSVREREGTDRERDSEPSKHGPNHAENREKERAATAEADSAELYDLDESQWKATATERGWSTTRYSAARSLAKSRQIRARTDAAALEGVRARGEDPRAWATERGWDDGRVRKAERFMKQAPGGGRPGASAQAEADADALSCMPSSEREAHTREWSEERRAAALEAVAAREPGIARDAKAMQRESYRGTDIDAWARARGWSEVRIRAAKLKMVW